MSSLDVTTSPVSEWTVDGYRCALARFRATAGNRDEPGERFIPLFETLNWAVAIVDQVWDKAPDEIVRGLRFARNRVHHQLAEALEPRDLPFPTVVTNRPGPRIAGPFTVLDWFWKPLDLLPVAPKRHEDPDGRNACRVELAGKPVEQALAHLDSLLSPPLVP